MDTGSTNAAAQELDMSQSGVSRLLTQLEQELDIELFTRHKGRLQLKPENNILLTHALKSLSDLEKLYVEANEVREGTVRKEVVRLAVPYTFSTHLMPNILHKILALAPNIVVEIITGNYEFIENSVNNGDADFGFSRIYNNPRFNYIPIASGSSVCIFPTDHDLAEKQSIVSKDLENIPLILLGKKSGSRHDIDLFFKSNNVAPNIKVEAHSVDVACSLVAKGIGVSIVNSVLLKGGCYPNIIARPIIELPRYQYGIITNINSDTSRVKQELYDNISNLMRDALTS